MEEAFLRQEMLLGKSAMERLTKSHVIVFGLGGVGSYCAEALARAGIGSLTLVDSDTVGETNLNRQLCALRSTLGLPKAEVMGRRVLDINPSCQVRALAAHYSRETSGQFFDQPYSYAADCIDLVSCKLDLIETAIRLNIPMISALGTGNKLDPSCFQVTDISKTMGCGLARVIRRELRARGIVHHKVVFSPEQPRKPADFAGEAPPPGRRSIPASVSWVPSVAGLMMAGAIVQDLIQDPEKPAAQ